MAIDCDRSRLAAGVDKGGNAVLDLLPSREGSLVSRTCGITT
jgi:hypothetical protein